MRYFLTATLYSRAGKQEQEVIMSLWKVWRDRLTRCGKYAISIVVHSHYCIGTYAECGMSRSRLISDDISNPKPIVIELHNEQTIYFMSVFASALLHIVPGSKWASQIAIEIWFPMPTSFLNTWTAKPLCSQNTTNFHFAISSVILKYPDSARCHFC